MFPEQFKKEQAASHESLMNSGRNMKTKVLIPFMLRPEFMWNLWMNLNAHPDRDRSPVAADPSASVLHQRDLTPGRSDQEHRVPPR